jgi:hypothetical protein
MNDWIAVEKKIINTEHKYFNLQFGLFEGKYEETDIFRFDSNWSRRVDHAGFNLNISIWNFYFMFNIYDNRHWCYKCDTYKTERCYDEKHEENEDE